MLVQLSTALSCIWLCGLAGSQLVPGFGQRVGYGPYYGLGQGQGQGQGYNQVQGIGYEQDYGYLQGQGSAHPNLPRYGYNQLQAQAYANLQRQPYRNLPGQRSQYLQTQGYPKPPIVGGFKKQILEVPPRQGHTQQQQREAWQNQIDQVVEVEEKLKQRALLGSENTVSGNTGSGNTGSGNTGRKNTRVESVVSTPVETFEIIDLSDEKYKKVGSVEKSEGLKVEEMNNQETEVVNNIIEIQKPRLVLKEDSLNQKSSYIEEAEKFLSEFNEKQKLKNILPASSESLIESSAADRIRENDDTSVVNAQSIRPDAAGKVKTEKLEQSQIEDILIENVNTKEGLKEIIKKLLKVKLESGGILGI